VPEGEQELSNVRLQHDLALSRGDQDPRFTQILWLGAADHSGEDERQRKFIDYLRNDERANSRAELLEGDIETLKTELYDKLASYQRAVEPAKHGSSTPESEPAPAEHAEAPPLVYIICSKADRTADHLRSLRKLLFERGCEPQLSREDSTDTETAAAAHLDRLAECDGFVIYHGSESQVWLEDRLMEFHKHLIGRKKKVKAKVVYLAPPTRPDKEDVFTHEASVLRSAETFAPELFEPLWPALRRADPK
jgi:hypothetical protein